MKPIAIALLAAVAAAGAEAASASDCPRWISVMPMRDDCAEELAADAADLGNTTFVDGILWSCPVNPGGDPPDEKGEIYAKKWLTVSALVREKSSVKQGILLQATMGHGGFPGTPTPWQLTVKPDGTSVYRMCPMDERFLAYIARTARAFSDAKPDFFMVDDDTRMVWGDTPGCFCPLHLAEFSKRTGRAWTREEVVKMLKRGDSPDAKMWEAVKVDSLRRFFKAIRDGFSPEIPGMLCVVGSEAHLRHAREFAQILAAPGQAPIVRGSGAPYHGRNLFHVVGARSSYARQLSLIGGDAVYMQECDTCPHTIWATSATRMFDHLVMLALEGCKGAKMWITRTGNYHEKKSGESYRRIFRENRGLMEWASRTDFRQKGVVVPVCGPSELNFGDRYFALTGIPYRFGKAGKGEVTALTEDTLKRMKPDEIREALSGAVLADGSAALWLSQNGYADDVGVKARPWKRRTVQLHEFEDGFRQRGMRPGELVDLSETASGAKVLTRLFNVPRAGATPEFEAPGSVLFETPRGGRVLSMAQAAPVQDPPYYAATLLSERYRDEIAKWLGELGGGIPGGLRYLGVGPVTCEAGTTDADGEVFVLNALDLDGDDAPEMEFSSAPASIERLAGDGTWRKVDFLPTGSGRAKIASPILAQRPAIFRWRPAASGTPARETFERTRNGVVFKGVEIHNAASLVPTNGMYRFCRVDARTFDALGDRVKARALTTTGVELRFRIRSGDVKIVMGGLSEKMRCTCRVYRGDFVRDWPGTEMAIDGTETVLSFSKASSAHLLKRTEKFGFRYHPDVIRVVLPPNSQIGIRDVIGDVEPPPPEMLPRKTYLAYGSSITHGSTSLLIERCYASLVGEALGADVRNVGLAGSAAMEKEIADFIAGEEFDFASLEMGVNVLGWMDVEEYERRVRYMVRRVAESHPNAQVLAIDVFRGEISRREKAQAFRTTLKRVVGELALPNVVYVNGLDALPEKDSLSTGSLHPSPHGHEEIARNLVGKFGHGGEKKE